MTEMTQNERSFIQAMKKSRDHEWHGLKLLLERKPDDSKKFLDALIDEGFFEPEKNPAPVPADDDRVHVPYWPSLDYLTACARQAAEQKDDVLAANVMGVVRKVSDGTDGQMRDNFHTAWKFAEIIGLLPNSVVKVADVDLVERWIGTRFSRLHVAHVLDEVAIGKFLASDVSEDWIKAVEIVRHCTAVRWVDDAYSDRKTPEPVVDEQSLSRLLDRHASDLARKAPSEWAALLEDRIREVFDPTRRERSDALRPAVEEHGQNRHGDALDNGLVAALRDVLPIWCDVDSEAVSERVKKLLKSDIEMLRRIGIHMLNNRWSSLGRLYSAIIAPELFRDGHIHELYNLLKDRFEVFSDDQKKRTIDAICRIPGLEGEDSEKQRQFTQLRWLWALSSAGYAPADKKISELRSAGLTVSDHPDFNAYLGVTSGWGGNSPYKVLEVVAFAEEGRLVERLNGFTPTGGPHGFTVGELVGVLAQAVEAAPETFREMLPKFVALSRPYQTGIINGFQAFWKKSKEQRTTFDWERGWRDVVTFFDAITDDVCFWNDVDGNHEVHGRDSIVCAMTDFLDAGTGDDANALPESILPEALKLIRRVLEKMGSADDARHSEPMMYAINVARGHAITAFFRSALRLCRLSDKRCASHEDAWREVQPVFDEELRKCRHGNWEFSTLAGAHLVNLDYMSAAWLRGNVAGIFPVDAESNFNCAVAGLAYSEFTRRIYVLLRDAGVIEHALELNLRGRETRPKLIERIMGAYLWKEETRGSPRVRHPFDRDSAEDLLSAVNFFWMIRGEALSSDQRAMIVDYWEDCVEWASGRDSTPSELLAGLGRLAWAMKAVDGRNLDLLLASASHMQRHFGTYVLLEQLERLVDASPAEVGRVFKKLVAAGVSVHDDDQDRLRTLILALNRRGQRKIALDCCSELIGQPGMSELYNQLTVEVPSSAA